MTISKPRVQLLNGGNESNHHWDCKLGYRPLFSTLLYNLARRFFGQTRTVRNLALTLLIRPNAFTQAKCGPVREISVQWVNGISGQSGYYDHVRLSYKIIWNIS